MFTIEGKVAFVTGALGGIGKAYVKHLLLNNVKGVALIDVVDESIALDFLNELAKEFGNDRAIYIKTDLANLENIEDAYIKTIARFNQLDIVVNNAGVVGEEDYIRTINVNLTATYHSTHLAMNKYIPDYRISNEGVIVNTASIAGFIPFDMTPTYTITKRGVVAIGDTLGTPTHYKRRQVRVLTICPGPTETPMIRGPVPDEVKEMFAYTLSWAYEGVQSADYTGLALIKVINEGRNGSVWVSHRSEPAVEVDLTQSRSKILKDTGYEVADPNLTSSK